MKGRRQRARKGKGRRDLKEELQQGNLRCQKRRRKRADLWASCCPLHSVPQKAQSRNPRRMQACRQTGSANGPERCCCCCHSWNKRRPNESRNSARTRGSTKAWLFPSSSIHLGTRERGGDCVRARLYGPESAELQQVDRGRSLLYVSRRSKVRCKGQNSD